MVRIWKGVKVVVCVCLKKIDRIGEAKSLDNTDSTLFRYHYKYHWPLDVSSTKQTNSFCFKITFLLHLSLSLCSLQTSFHSFFQFLNLVIHQSWFYLRQLLRPMSQFTPLLPLAMSATHFPGNPIISIQLSVPWTGCMIMSSC